jgi:hypothetical protein
VLMLIVIILLFLITRIINSCSFIII